MHGGVVGRVVGALLAGHGGEEGSRNHVSSSTAFIGRFWLQMPKLRLSWSPSPPPSGRGDIRELEKGCGTSPSGARRPGRGRVVCHASEAVFFRGSKLRQRHAAAILAREATLNSGVFRARVLFFLQADVLLRMIFLSSGWESTPASPQVVPSPAVMRVPGY